MTELLTPEALTAFFQVIMIDLVLAGDNAVVIGLAAAGLPQEQRTKAIIVGIVAATTLRIVLAGMATQLLKVLGLLFAGGLLLLWVCWKMWRELQAPAGELAGDSASPIGYGINVDGTIAAHAPRKTFAQAAGQIMVADVSMSLDNVLAVAGAAREHPVALVFGLGSIALMGLAASFIAHLLQRHRWIAYLGLAVIVYVALEMTYRGVHELRPVVKAIAGL